MSLDSANIQQTEEVDSHSFRLLFHFLKVLALIEGCIGRHQLIPLLDSFRVRWKEWRCCLMIAHLAPSALRERALIHCEFFGFASQITLKLTPLFIYMTIEITSGPCY